MPLGEIPGTLIGGDLYYKVEGFYKPHDANLKMERPSDFQLPLDTLVAEKAGRKGEIGELFRTITLSSVTIEVVVFDFTSGQQIGYAGAFTMPSDPPPTFTTGIAIATRYKRQGFGTLVREYIKHIAAISTPSGAKFLEVNTAVTPGERQAVEQILRQAGAKRDPVVRNAWHETMKNPHRDVPLSFPASAVLFRAEGPLKSLPFGPQIQRRGSGLYVNDIKIGELDKRQITVIEQQNTTDFWQGVLTLWKKAIELGFRPELHLEKQKL